MISNKIIFKITITIIYLLTNLKKKNYYKKISLKKNYYINSYYKKKLYI